MQVNELNISQYVPVHKLDQFAWGNSICHENNRAVSMLHLGNVDTPPFGHNLDVVTQFNRSYYNGYYFYILGAGFNLKVTTDLQLDSDRTYYLNLDHCSTLVDGIPRAQIDIYVNGQRVLENYNPQNGGNFSQQHMDITKFLQDGENTINIQNRLDARSNYWLSSLSILTDEPRQ